MANDSTLPHRPRRLLWTLGSFGAAAAVYLTLIQNEQHALALARQLLVETEAQSDFARSATLLAAEIDAELEAVRAELDRKEKSMLSGDPFFAMIKILEQFQETHAIEVDHIGVPLKGQWKPLPEVPYETATFTTRGRGTYHDFGRFLAQFENRLPYATLNRLELKPASEFTIEDPAEQLVFEMEFSILTRSLAAGTERADPD